MPEELVLDEPVVIPEVVTNKYRVVVMTFDTETMSAPPVTPPDVPGPMVPGLVEIRLRDNNGGMLTHRYLGDEAIVLIKSINTANLTTKSLQKRMLEKLSRDGVIPGTVTGTPDPIIPE
jgi:hypothetical protein